jgi:hypothetical protein
MSLHPEGLPGNRGELPSDGGGIWVEGVYLGLFYPESEVASHFGENYGFVGQGGEAGVNIPMTDKPMLEIIWHPEEPEDQEE